MFITTLHQGFDVYRSKLDEKIRNEWDKVKGRLKEITFNEPVEQLLHLAAEFLQGNPAGITNRDFNSLFKAIRDSRVYPLNNNLSGSLAKQLFPFDLISAGVLAKSLQKYGQNERSLFTFLETNSFADSIKNGNDYFDLASVYDYLLNNFYSLLSTKYNPDYMRWSVIRNSIDRLEILFDKDAEAKRKLIKAIGLLNIFAPAGARINGNFLKTYGKLALGVGEPHKQLAFLEAKKIVRYQSYSDSYVLFEGTDLDIDLALNEAENYVASEPDIVAKLNEYFQFPYLAARASYATKGTPRFFEFRMSNRPEVYKPKGEVDGVINLIFSDKIDLEILKSTSGENKEAFLYAVYKNSGAITDTLREIDKVDYVLQNVADDHVAQRELKSLRASLVTGLNNLVVDSLFDGKSQIVWIFKGRTQEVNSRSELNKLLSEIINDVYKNTPVFGNELINREKLPGAISAARRTLLQNLIENWGKEDLGFEMSKFPPDKTIYLSLLKNTGIHHRDNREMVLEEPTDKSFKALWKVCEDFLDSCKSSKRRIIELTEVLSDRPFKLKKGFVDFWLPIYLFIRRDDYALFDNDSYIPHLNVDVFDLVIKYPQNYFVKTFDVQGIKLELFNRYRTLINRSKEERITTQSFIDTIRPFLTFYRGLPEYSKTTSRLSKKAKVFRDAIASSKDPEKTFFEDLPEALGFSSISLYESDKHLEEFVIGLQTSIREIRTSFEELLNRIEHQLLDIFGYADSKFPDYREILVERYSSIKRYMLLPYQKAFYSRLNSGLDDRKAWIGSIVQSLIGKNVELITDDEEPAIHEKLKDILEEFDNLCEFANLDIDEVREEAIKVEVTALHDLPQKIIIRLPRQKPNETIGLEEKLRSKLSKDRTLNLSVLLRLLREQMNDK